MESRRHKRVTRAIQHEVSKIVLYELSDPRIGAVTVTNVDASPDLRNAKILISILGSEVSQKTVMRGLEHARGHIQAEIAARLKLRFTPIITFSIDESMKKSIRVLEIINEVSETSEESEEEDI